VEVEFKMQTPVTVDPIESISVDSDVDNTDYLDEIIN